MGLLGKYFGDNYDSVAGVFWIDDFGSSGVVELPRHRSSVPEPVTPVPEPVEGTVTFELVTLVASTGSATQPKADRSQKTAHQGSGFSPSGAMSGP